MKGMLRTALPLFLLCAALPALADADLHGRVIDETGAPIAGARVLLYDSAVGLGQRRVAEGMADADGAWALSAPDRPAEPGGGSYSVVALAPGRAVWGRMYTGPTEEPLDIVLGTPSEQTGRVLGPDGAPIVGARVRLWGAMPPGNGTVRDGLSLIPTDLQDELCATTDEDGRYRLALTPAGWRVTLVCEVRELGEIRRWRDASVIDFPFPEPGRIHGRIVGTDAPGQFAGFRFWLNSFESLGEGLQAVAEATVRADGTFEIPALPAATYHMGVGEQVSEALHLRGRFNIVVKPKEETVLEVPAEPVVRLRGRVVDADTEQAVPGATVYAYFTGRTIIYESQGTAAEDGTFDLPCLPGEAALSIGTSDEGPARAYDYYAGNVAVGSRGTDMGDVPLRALHIVVVRVVDGTGAPVEEATVRNEMTYLDGTMTDSDEETKHGVAELRLPPGTAKLSAHAGLAHTAASTVVVATPGRREQLTLVLSAASRCGLTARITLPDGSPVAGVRCRVETVRQGRIASGDVRFSAVNGTVAFEGLEPNVPCRLVVTPSDAEGLATPWRELAAGEVCGLGDLTARPFTGALSGTVVDAEGSPVSGASVVAYSLAQVGTTSLTDAAGHFRIECIPPWGVALVARAPGHPLGGAAATPGAGYRLVLGDDESAVRAAEPTAEDRALALGIAETSLTGIVSLAGQEHAPWELGRLLGEVAPLAPDRVRAFARRGGAEAEYLVEAALVDASLAQSTDATIGRLDGLGADMAGSALLNEILTLVDKRPEAARLRATTALRYVEQVEMEWLRATWRAQAGRVLHLLGEPDGEALILQAVAETQALDGTDDSSTCRRFVAPALAVIDLEEGLRMAASAGDAEDRARALANIACRLAPREPDRALAILASIEDRWRREQAQVFVLPFLPAERLEDALRIARDMEHAQWRIATLVRLATRCAPARAPELLLEAADAAEANQDHDFLSWTQDRGLASLACVARRLGTGQERQFALRGFAVSEQRMRDRMADRASLSGCARTAEALAFIDRDLARVALSSGIAANGGEETLLSDALGGRPIADSVLAAAAEIDVEWALELWRRLDAPKGVSLATERFAGARAITHRLVATVAEREVELLHGRMGGSSGPDVRGWVVEETEW